MSQNRMSQFSHSATFARKIHGRLMIGRGGKQFGLPVSQFATVTRFQFAVVDVPADGFRCSSVNDQFWSARFRD